MDKPDGRRGSEVLDAIYEQLEDKPGKDSPASILFRTQALEQLDVAAEVDTRLPLVSRRSWLLLVGVALLVVAFALWASLTPSISSVTAQGRVMSASGALPVAAESEGEVVSVIAPSTVVSKGDQVAQLLTSSGQVAVRATTAGTVWQQMVVPGQAVAFADPIVTVLPEDSANHALLPVREAEAAPMTPGMQVNVTAGLATTGTVSTFSGPMSAQTAGERTGLVLPPDTTYVLVTVDLATPLPPGAPATGVVVLSEGTVLNRLLGSS